MKYARQCSVTGEGMNEGWCFCDGQDYAKYEEGAVRLSAEYGYSSLQDAYDDDACYWTEWQEDYQYEVVGGILVEI